MQVTSTRGIMGHQGKEPHMQKTYLAIGDVSELLACFQEDAMDEWDGGYWSSIPDMNVVKDLRDPTPDELACHRFHMGWEDNDGGNCVHGRLLGIARIAVDTGCGAMQPGDDEYEDDEVFVWEWDVI